MKPASHYDVLIVGGGINGCALARAAAGRGLRTALVEKRDFGAGVTSRSTRLIHGGLRYLETFQLGLVRESLADREALLREFPGQVVPQPFVLPVYSADSRRPWYLASGLALYRLLAGCSDLPAHRRLSAEETLALLPGLDADGLLCGFEYYDCQAVYPERLALEMALRAEERGATVRNHATVTGFLASGPRIEGVRMVTSRGEESLRSRVVVNASGAWADRVLGLLPNVRPRRMLHLVNGAHIAVEAFPGAPRHAVYHEARSDRRPFFVVPWRGMHLIGTTETHFDGDPDRMLATDGEIRYLLEETNSLFPQARLGRESILYAYCGSRPLLRSGSASLNRAPRGHALVDHARSDGIQGLLTMAGGKLTTALSFAERAVRAVERKLGRKRAAGKGLRARRELPAGLPPRVASTYGSRAADLGRFVAADPDRAAPAAAGCETTRGEVLFAAAHEKARTLGDIMLRRTGMAFDPRYSESWSWEVARTVAPALDWNRSRVAQAVAEYERELDDTLAERQSVASASPGRVG